MSTVAQLFNRVNDYFELLTIIACEKAEIPSPALAYVVEQTSSDPARRDDSTEFVEVTEFVPVIARPPIDSVLLADMQTFLGEDRSGIETALHEQGRLRVDIWLIETRVAEQIGLIKNKLEGTVRIDVRVSDAAAGETHWEHSFTGVGTEQGMFMGKRHYRRALSNAYCSALDMIKNALDSPTIAPSTRTTEDRPIR